jgi:hypothetical protein
MKPSVRLNTPLGIGTFQGFMPVLTNGVKVNKLMIRLPINAQTEPHRRDSNCVTKGATTSGLWLFHQTEVEVVRETK